MTITIHYDGDGQVSWHDRRSDGSAAFLYSYYPYVYLYTGKWKSRKAETGTGMGKWKRSSGKKPLSDHKIQ